MLRRVNSGLLRLFVAIDVPDEARNAVAAMSQPVEAFHWTKRDQLHLTLQFLGDTEPDLLPVLKSTLAAISAEKFILSQMQLDVFPSIRKPRVVVIRFSPCDALVRLQQAVHSGIVSSGIRVDNRFKPHVTIARLRDAKAGTVRNYLKAAVCPTLEMEIGEFHLYESHLGPKGARHEKLRSYKLGAGD